MKDIPDFKTDKELFDFLVENKKVLIAQKKAVTKFSDEISIFPVKQLITNKAVDTEDMLNRSVIINTTNILDSHRDLHIRGLWKKSLQENKNIFYIQEHEMKFTNVIADGNDLKAIVKDYQWSELGFDLKGKTQALQFDVAIRRERNPFMFGQFRTNRVKQNSVSMRYVRLEMAINDEDYPDEFEIWNKYYDEIANKDAAENISYFWVVLEAKVIEGSAVLAGSNSFTPVLDKSEPPEHSEEEPSFDTLDYTYLTKNFSLQ